MSTRKERGWCSLCRSKCGTVNTIVDGRLVRVEPDFQHPTGKALCAKGRAGPEIAHSSRRLLRPLKRTRPKTDPDPGWVEIGWDEALDEIAARLNAIRSEHGAEAVVFPISSPSGTAIADCYEWSTRFVRLFGSPNICDAMEICNWQKDFAHRFTFGFNMPTPDFSKSDLVILWGYNPANAWLSHSNLVAEAVARGAQVMVVDPRRTGHALQASHWLGLRPGTDGVLAMGLAKIIVDGGMYDERFVREWSNAPMLVRSDTGEFLRGGDVDASWKAEAFVGWSAAEGRLAGYDQNVALGQEASLRFALRGRYAVEIDGRSVECRPAFDHYAESLSIYTPAHVAGITGLSEAAITAAALTIARSKRISYHCWTGISQHAHATQTERAIALLYALTGCFDAEGGNVRLNKQPVNLVTDPAMLGAQLRKALGADARPIGPPALGTVTASDLYRSILDGEPYRTRAMFAFGSNILLSLPDPEKGRRALEQLEFHVQCDMFMTPTASFADIVLPVNSLWEREALRVGFEVSAEAEELVQLRPRMVEPQGESKSDLWIIFQLATRLGMGDQFFGGDIETAWNHILAPIGTNTAQLRASPGGIVKPIAQGYEKHRLSSPQGGPGFPTETRRVEIWSALLHRHGQPGVPQFEQEVATPDYPVILTNARRSYFCHSQHRSIVSLRKRAMEPTLEISAALAAMQSIRNGDWVVAETSAGRARFTAHIDVSLLSDVAVGDYGWWEPNHDLGLPGQAPLGPGHSNFNALIPVAESDPVSGAVALRSTRCAIHLETPRTGIAADDEREFIVDQIQEEVTGTVTLALMPADGAPLPAFRPGQHIVVKASSGLPEPVSRSYSLSSAASSAGRNSPDAYRITVKEVLAGLMSPHLNRVVERGQRVSVQGPGGRFALPLAPDFPVVMIAAGVGVTPFMSFLESIATAAKRPSAALYFVNRNSATHPFKRRLAELAGGAGGEATGLYVANFYSRPLPSDRPSIDYDHARRMTPADIDQRFVEARARFYLCGPSDMLRDMTAGLVARGVPPFEIFQESFWLAPIDVVQSVDATHVVSFARSGIDATWSRASGSLLELAEHAGIAVSGGCRVGQCESCALRLVSGSVGHSVANDAIEPGTVLSCQAVPLTDIVIDA